jgi:hypothetical protein
VSRAWTIAVPPPRWASQNGRWWRFGLLSVVVAGIYVLAVGIPTGVIPNPLFDRVLGVDVANLLSLLLPAALFGPLGATYLVPWPPSCRIGGRTGSGGILSFLAAGCPVCNKLVVLAVGVSGAVDYFRPLQPLLGAASVMLLGAALLTRLRARAPEPVPDDVPVGPGRAT